MLKTLVLQMVQELLDVQLTDNEMISGPLVHQGFIFLLLTNRVEK